MSLFHPMQEVETNVAFELPDCCGAKILIPTGARTISLAFGRTSFL